MAKKGFIMTQEHKDKISKAKKGKSVPIKHDKQFKKGHTPWNVNNGVRLNDALIKWRENGGEPWNKGLKGKDNPNTGRVVSEDGRRNISEGRQRGFSKKMSNVKYIKDNCGHVRIECKCIYCDKTIYKRTDTFKDWSGRCQRCGCLFKYKGLVDKRELNEREKIRKSKEYKEWRKLVLSRDNYCCIICGYVSIKKGDIIADHINPFHLFPELRLDVSNGRTLCLNCNYVYGYHAERDKTKIININCVTDKKFCWKSAKAI